MCGHDLNLWTAFGASFTIGASDIDQTVVKQTCIQRRQVAQESRLPPPSPLS
jgi:hypothetical protein